MAPPLSAAYHVTIAIRGPEESRASAGDPSCRSRHRSSANAAPRSALPRLSGSGLFRARSSPGSAAPRRSRRPLERGRRTCGTAKEGAIRCRFFGRLPRGMARGARARLEKLRSRPALPTRLRWPPPTRRRSQQVRLLGDVERGARRLTSLLPSTTTTAATVGAFARALRGRVLTSCRGCHRYSSDEGRGKGCSGDGPGGEARPATGPLPPPTAPGPCTRRRLAANFPCLRATRLGSTPKHARL